MTAQTKLPQSNETKDTQIIVLIVLAVLVLVLVVVVFLLKHKRDRISSDSEMHDMLL